MKPIDTIRGRIDSDLTKYHNVTLCKLHSDSDIKNIRGVGLVAKVSPVNKYSQDDPFMTGEDYSFVVTIVNRPYRWMESNVSSKYYVAVINIVQDRGSSGLGFLVSKTLTSNQDIFKSSGDISSRIKNENGDPLTTMTKENILWGY